MTRNGTDARCSRASAKRELYGWGERIALRGSVPTPVLLAVCVLASSACAEFKPHNLFSDGAVLQQGAPVPVWGFADPGDAITVEFAGQKKAATTGPDGRWSVTLDPLKASSQPGEIRFACANPQSAIRNLQSTNVLVGEVWLCSGQSNMAWPLSKTTNAQAAIAAAADPQLRLWSSSSTPGDEPPRDVQGQWRECSPESVASFSAVAYYCGRDLRRALNAPVALVHAAVNGTSAEAWISRPALDSEPRAKSAIDRFEERVQEYSLAMTQHPEALAKHKEAVEKAKQEGKEPPAEPRAKSPTLAVGMVRLLIRREIVATA
jgi:sialate O-acetylesterase